MNQIQCGWCGQPTIDEDACERCGRDPRLAWEQRGSDPVRLKDKGHGRPDLEVAEVLKVYEGAREALRARGVDPTVEAIAEELGRSPRTIRDWRHRFGFR